MPDLQTELNKVINTWNQPEMTAEPTTPDAPSEAPLGHRIFDLIKTHPGRTLEEYEAMAPQHGMNVSSVHNYINSFCKPNWGLAKRDNGKISVLTDAYKTKNEVLGLPRGARVSEKRRRRLTKARTQPGLPLPYVPRGALQNILFECVQKFPGVKRASAVAYAEDRGMKSESASVTLGALIRSGRITDMGDRLYMPAFLDATHSQPAADREEVKPIEKPQTIDVEALTLREAKALFEQLQKYFSL